MNLRDQAVKGVFWSLLEKWGRKLVDLAVFLLLARLLEPDAFGLVALAGVYIAFMQVFVDQGFADAIVQRDDLEDEHLDTAFWTNLALGTTIALLSVAVASLIAHLTGEPELTPLIRWLSLAFLFNALSRVQHALFRRSLAFQVLSIRTLIASSAGGAVGVGMALAGYGVWSLVGQQLTVGGVGTAILWQASNWRPGTRLSKRHFNDLFSFGAGILGANVVNFFNRHSDDLLIGSFLGSTALGYYTVAYRVLRALTNLLASVVSEVTFPVFSRMQSEPERLRNAFYTTTRFTSLIAFPIFVGLAVTAPEIVPALFGEKWDPSIPIMQVLAFIGILHTAFYFNDNVILAKGKSSWELGLNLLSAVLNVVAFAIAVRWGILAVAAAYVLRGYLLAPLKLWVVRELIQIDFLTYLRNYLVPLLASAVMAGVLLTLRGFTHEVLDLYVLLGVLILAGAVTYVVAVFLISPSQLWQALELGRQLFLQQSYEQQS